MDWGIPPSTCAVAASLMPAGLYHAGRNIVPLGGAIVGRQLGTMLSPVPFGGTIASILLGTVLCTLQECDCTCMRISDIMRASSSFSSCPLLAFSVHFPTYSTTAHTLGAWVRSDLGDGICGSDGCKMVAGIEVNIEVVEVDIDVVVTVGFHSGRPQGSFNTDSVLPLLVPIL